MAVIRAALEYWDNEMSPHDPSIYTAYFDEPIGSGDWINDAVTELRQRLPTCRLRYILCSPDGDTLIDHLMYETLDQIPETSFTELNPIVTAVISTTSK